MHAQLWNTLCHAGLLPHIHTEPLAAVIAAAFGIVLYLVASGKAVRS